MKHTGFILATIILCLMFPIAASEAQTIQTSTRTTTEAAYYGACMIRGGEAQGTRMDEPFAMHSVMKFPQALYAAEYMRRHSIALDDTIIVRKRQLMQDTWSPMLKMFDGGTRAFTYAELLQLSLAQSDNNACDLLFERLGNPEEVEAYIHRIGFADIHIRHNEREMAANHAFSLENNTTPRAMARLFAWLYEHKNADKYLEFVWQAMTNCTTGTERLPAIVPQGATLAHKTGTGYRNTDNTQYRNDTGIIIMPDGSWLAIAVFAPHAREEADVARIARGLIGGNSILIKKEPNLTYNKNFNTKYDTFKEEWKDEWLGDILKQIVFK